MRSCEVVFGSQQVVLEKKTFLYPVSGHNFSSVYRAKVTITDLPEFVPLMRLNVDMNKHLCKYPVAAEALRWGDDVSSRFSNVDIVLIADCIYYKEVRVRQTPL